MPRIITRDQVKLYLGIQDTSLDAQIDTYLPIIDSAVKQITRRDWNDRYTLSTNSGSVTARIFPLDAFNDPDIHLRRSNNVGNQFSLSNVGDTLQPGQTISGSNVTADTHIIDVYIQEFRDQRPFSGVGGFGEYTKSITLELSQVAPSSASATVIVGMNIAYFPVISKGVNWFIQKQNTNNPDSQFRTKRVGPLTLTRSELDAEIDGRYGVPSWLVKALPRYARGY